MVEAPKLLEGVSETFDKLTKGLDELSDKVSLKKESVLYKNFTKVDKEKVKEKSTGFMKAIGGVFNINIPLLGTLGSAFDAKWPIDIFGDKKKREDRKMINTLLSFFGVKGGLEELHRDYIDDQLKDVNHDFVKKAFGEYSSLSTNETKQDLWKMYKMDLQATSMDEKQKTFVKDKLPDNKDNLKESLITSFGENVEDIKNVKLNIGTVSLIGDGEYIKEEGGKSVIDYQKIFDGKETFVNKYLNVIIPKLAFSGDGFLNSELVDKKSFALAIFGCLVGERYFMEGLNLGLLSSDQYQDIAPTDKKKEKEKGPNENWPNLVLGGGIIEINQDDIDLVDSVPTIIEKIKVKGELANIKDVKYNNESIIKCEGDTPYINKKAMKDVIGFGLLFHKKTGKTLNIASSYRTQAHQERLVAENATEREYRDGNGDIQNGKVPTAPVGYSGHNQGLSIDINSNLLSDLNHTDLKSLKGLQELAGIFNFNSISSEAWHFDHQSFSDQLVGEDVGNVEKGKRFAESTKMDESYQANRANRA